MKKQRFTAIFGGGCYIKGYRSFYRHGYLLCNIAQGDSIIIPQQRISKVKAFDVLDAVADSGKNIAFDAILEGDTVKYIANVQLI